jgi:hypothetical protein
VSDQSQGPGWWLASDGKWYPPQPATPPAAEAPTEPVQPVGPPTQAMPPVGPPQQTMPPAGGPAPYGAYPAPGAPGQPPGMPPQGPPPGQTPGGGGGKTGLIIGLVVLVVLLLAGGLAFALTRSSDPVASTASTAVTTTTAKADETTTTKKDSTTTTEEETTTTKKKNPSTSRLTTTTAERSTTTESNGGAGDVKTYCVTYSKLVDDPALGSISTDPDALTAFNVRHAEDYSTLVTSAPLDLLSDLGTMIGAFGAAQADLSALQSPEFAAAVGRLDDWYKENCKAYVSG